MISWATFVLVATDVEAEIDVWVGTDVGVETGGLRNVGVIRKVGLEFCLLGDHFRSLPGFWVDFFDEVFGGLWLL